VGCLATNFKRCGTPARGRSNHDSPDHDRFLINGFAEQSLFDAVGRRSSIHLSAKAEQLFQRWILVPVDQIALDGIMSALPAIGLNTTPANAVPSVESVVRVRPKPFGDHVDQILTSDTVRVYDWAKTGT
jgi:hypothetical protein